MNRHWQAPGPESATLTFGRTADPLGPKPPSKHAQRFPLASFQSLKPGTEAAWLVKRLIPRVGLTLVWGPPKCGKSFWTFDMALAVARGIGLPGRRVHGGPVVYCAFEGAAGFLNRAEAYRLQNIGEAADGNPPFYLSSAPIDLVRERGGLTASIREHLGPNIPRLSSFWTRSTAP